MKSRAQADVPTEEETREKYFNSLNVAALKVELTKVGVRFVGNKKKEYYVGLALDSSIVVPGSSSDMGGASGSGSGVTGGASSSAASGALSTAVVGAPVMPTFETTGEDGKDATSGLSAGASSSAKDGTQIAEESTSVEDVHAMGADGVGLKSAATASSAQPPLNQPPVIPTSETTAEAGKDGTSGSESGSTAAHAGIQPPCGAASVGALKAFSLSAGDIVDIHGWSPIGEYQFSGCTILLICDHPMIEENLLIWYERTLRFPIGTPSTMLDEEELSFPMEQGKLVSLLISKCICNLN